MTEETDKKITDLTELTDPTSDDLLVAVDISDTADDPEGTSKKLTIGDLLAGSTPYLNVKNYGALGDGVTDDTAAIEAAIADLPAGNRKGVIFFPGVDVDAGEFYKVTSTILYTSGTKFLGESWTNAKISGSVAGPIFKPDNAVDTLPAYLEFNNVTVLNTSTNSLARCLTFIDCGIVRIFECALGSAKNYVCDFQNTNTVYIRDTYFQAASACEYVLNFDTGANIIVIENSHFFTAKGGIHITGPYSDSVVIRSNNFTSIGDSSLANHCIFIENSILARGYDISANYWEDCHAKAIVIRVGAVGMNIAGNKFFDCMDTFLDADYLTDSAIMPNSFVAGSYDANCDCIVLGAHTTRNIIGPQSFDTGGTGYTDGGTNNVKLGTW